MLENILTVITAITGLLLAIQQFLKSPLGQSLSEYLTSGNYQKAKDLLSEQAFAIVARYQQQFVDGLKEDLKDGTISKEELKLRLIKIKAQAFTDFKNSAGGGALLQALRTLGVRDVDAELEQLLEAAILKLKRTAGLSVGLPIAGQPSGTWATPSAASLAAAKNDLKGLAASDQAR